MAEKTTQFSKEGSSEFSEQAIRRFLFGRLSAKEHSMFAERLFADESLERRVHLAEHELADDYAFERLSAEERSQFEQRFLVSADRKLLVRVSSALRDRFSSPAAVQNAAPFGAQTTVRERLLRQFGFNQPAWSFAFGVVIVLLLIGTAWLVVREPRLKEGIRARIFTKRRPVPAPTREAAHPDVSPAPVHQNISSPTRDHEPKVSPPATPETSATGESNMASIVLSPNDPRDGDKLPRVNLPKGEHGIVRLQLALKPNQLVPYRAELLTIAGYSVFTAQSLKRAADAKVDFDIPAGLMKTGDYQVRLSWVSDEVKKGAAGYYFRVQ
jgi:anti-sigma factor RsiW